MMYGAIYGFGDKPVSEKLKDIEDCGYDYVEIYLDYPFIDKIEDNEIGLIKNSKLGVAFHAPYEILLAGRPEMAEASAEILKKCIDFAAQFKPLYMTFHINTNLGISRFPEICREVKEAAAEKLINVVDHGNKLGVKLLIENNNEEFMGSVPDILKICRNVGISFCFDPGHALKSSWISSDKNNEKRVIEEWTDRLKDMIVAIHLYDTKLGDNVSPKNHLSFGYGDSDIILLTENIKKTKAKYITLEIMGDSKKENVIPRNILLKNIKFIKEIWR